MRLAVSGKTVAATWTTWRLERRVGSAPGWGRRGCRSPRRCKSGGVTLSTLVCSLVYNTGSLIAFQHAYKKVTLKADPNSELAKRLGRSLALRHPEHVEAHSF